MATDLREPRTDTTDTHVRFKPSKVEGFPGAVDIDVYPDRLRVEAGGRWHDVPFADIAVFQEPAWASRLKGLLGGRPLRPLVGDLFYDRARYGDSYIRFFTEPRLIVYMPAEGPALYPDSHFWRVQEVLRRGGYAARDFDSDRELREQALARRPRWLRAAGKALFFAALLNVCAWMASAMYLGGLASGSEGGKYYFAARGRDRWEVSREVWVYSRVHTRVVWVLVPLGMLGGIVADIPLSSITRRGRQEPRHRAGAHGPPG